MAELNGADKELQLCFNCAHFQRSDFNVERFVNLTRKRATLDQLQSDLRIYLRHLQNAMIELINDDYADFVNLSSSLAALRDSVDKVTTDVQSNWSAFAASNAELEKCSGLVEQNLAELAQAQKKQLLCRDKLSLLQSIQFLHIFITKQPKTRNVSWYSKLALLVSTVELWGQRTKFDEMPQSIQRAKTDCHRKVRDILLEGLTDELSEQTTQSANLSILVSLLKLIIEEEFAVSYVVQQLAKKRIDLRNNESEKTMESLLKNVLDQVLRLRETWVQKARKCRQFTCEVATFVDICLLNFVSSFLEERFSTVLIPSDVRLFHKCYRMVAELGTRWPARGHTQRSLLQSLRDKFNLVVYFKLASQPLLAALKDQSVPEAFKFEAPDDKDESNYPCLSPYSNSLLLTLDTLYSAEMFLPPLADKFWEFTLQRMDDYLNWALKLIEHFSHNATSVEDERSPPLTAHSIRTNFNPSNDANSSKSPHWLPLTALRRDLHLFDTNLFQFCLTTVWQYLRELHVDTTPFGQCLSRFSEQLAHKRKEIDDMITRQLGAELAKNLSAVSDIPRQYRWTKRPPPTAFSAYLASAFNICETFGEEAENLHWTDEERRNVLVKATEQAVEEFCERAEKVLESVEQTGSSLLRFKQRKANALGGQQQSASEGTETDESKIRAQLRFDANLVQQRAMELGLAKLERLEQIEQRAGREGEKERGLVDGGEH